MHTLIDTLKRADVWMAILTTIFTLVGTVFSIVASKIAKIRKKETDNIYNIVIENEQKQKEKAINEIVLNLPQGLSDDEYFTRLRKAISEASLNNLKANTSFEDNIDSLISNHHEQALRQSSIQFWFSLIASIIGFIFIILMIVLSNGTQWYEYIVKILPGVIIEAVSILFFSQSKETRERSSDFLNKLREDKQYAKSIVITDSVEDEKLRAIVKAKIALHMSGIKDTDIK